MSSPQWPGQSDPGQNPEYPAWPADGQPWQGQQYQGRQYQGQQDQPFGGQTYPGQQFQGGYQSQTYPDQQFGGQQYPGQFPQPMMGPGFRGYGGPPRRGLKAVISLAVIVVVGVGAGFAAHVVGTSGHIVAQPRPSAVTTHAIPATPVPAGNGRVIATFTGRGIKKTATFAIGGTGAWVLTYSYDCTAFGVAGNFIVFEDGGRDLSGVHVNELSRHGHGIARASGDAGRHYLAIDSECSWQVQVTQ